MNINIFKELLEELGATCVPNTDIKQISDAMRLACEIKEMTGEFAHALELKIDDLIATSDEKYAFEYGSISAHSISIGTSVSSLRIVLDALMRPVVTEHVKEVAAAKEKGDM